MFAQGRQVARRAVSLVGGQAIDRKDRIPGRDHAIAFDFGDDRGGGDGGRERVAMNNVSLGKVAIEFHGVDQEIAGGGRQLLDGMEHGETRCLVDIDLIDAG